MLTKLLRKLNPNSKKVEQAISFDQLIDKSYELLWLADEAAGDQSYSRMLSLFLESDGSYFALITTNGQLYKQRFTIVEDDVFLADRTKIDIEAQETKSDISVYQQEDGRHRFLSISATTALNKNGLLNSKELYDSFVEYAETTGNYPIINFYHQGQNTRLGECDYVARDGNLYIVSGLFDDNKFGRAAAQSTQESNGYWGNSIEFYPLDQRQFDVTLDGGETVSIPVHTKGINNYISILPAHEAACIGTVHMGLNMEKKVKDELIKLVGQENADEFEERANLTNQSVEGMIHQSVEEDVVTEVSEEDTIEEQEEEGTIGGVIELGEDFLENVVEDVLTHQSFTTALETLRQESNQIFTELTESINTLTAQLQQIQQTTTTVADTIQERRENDLPLTRVNYRRPRQNTTVNPTEQETKSYADIARSTLDKKLNRNGSK